MVNLNFNLHSCFFIYDITSHLLYLFITTDYYLQITSTIDSLTWFLLTVLGIFLRTLKKGYSSFSNWSLVLISNYGRSLWRIWSGGPLGHLLVSIITNYKQMHLELEKYPYFSCTKLWPKHIWRTNKNPCVAVLLPKMFLRPKIFIASKNVQVKKLQIVCRVASTYFFSGKYTDNRQCPYW